MLLSAVMKKIHKMASDDRALHHSALQKIHEFLNLDYPKKMLWTTCTSNDGRYNQERHVV